MDFKQIQLIFLVHHKITLKFIYLLP